MSNKISSNNGRVKTIKSKFENLNILETLDIPSQTIKVLPAFSRSVTCLNFSTGKDIKATVKKNTVLQSKKNHQNIDLISELTLRNKNTDNDSNYNTVKRQSYDSKRGSIKRSPAFRVVGNENKSRASSLSPKELVNMVKIEEIRNDDSLEINLTDTLKKALKQPLPNGPPPKKPPRTFNSPIREVNIIQEFKDIEAMNNKINIEGKEHEETLLQKEAAIIPSQSILSCISCFNNGPIYDTTVEFSNQSSNHNRKNSFNIKDVDKPKPAENFNDHIYMEPYNCVIPKDKSSKSNVPENTNQLLQSFKCIQKHSSNQDLHYLCTNISTLENSKNYSSEENNSINTYDEINILLDAAFDEKNQINNDLPAVPNPKMNITLTRSLTEKRKDYVRRISKTIHIKSIAQQYGTLHRDDKFAINKDEECYYNARNLNETETTKDLINKYNKLSNVTNNFSVKNTPPGIDENENNLTNSTNNNSPVKLFQMCLLVGYNISTNQPYIKMKYPPNEPHPPNIEFIVFPSKSMLHEKKENQDYSLILTNDNQRIYGYCRRVLPEISEICLPLAYCIITENNAPGFYYKILKEIESRHGHPDSIVNFLLKHLRNHEIPEYGKFLQIQLPVSPRPKLISNVKLSSGRRLSLETTPKWLTETATQQMNQNFKDMDAKSKANKNEKYPKLLSKVEEVKPEDIIISRPNDLRLESAELNDLFQSLGAELLLNIFGTLLLERTVILYSSNISLLSSCVLGLQSILYPFQWQYVWITVLPENLQEISQAPVPVLAGSLIELSHDIEEGVFVNLEKKTILQKHNDVIPILPDSLRKSLRISLEMVNLLDQGKILSSVLIAEAFLRFFVELFGPLNVETYEKDNFIKMHSCPSIKLFLEWFLDTAMFADFLFSKHESLVKHQKRKYFELFDTKLIEKSENKPTFNHNQSIEMIMKNCKIINKKEKSFKTRFKEFLHVNQTK